MPRSWHFVKAKPDDAKERAFKIWHAPCIEGGGFFGLLSMPLLLGTATLLATWRTEHMQRAWFSAWHTVGTQ